MLGGLAAAVFWLQSPMGFQPQVMNAPSNDPVLDLSIEPGTSPKAVAQAIADAGADVSPQLLWLWFRVSGQDRAIKAGSYEISPDMSPRRVLNMLARGEESLKTVVLVEGWTFKQFKQALAKSEALKNTAQALSDAEIMAQLGRPGTHPEGRFYPDTYTYAKGSTDMAVMQRALKAMDRQLADHVTRALQQALRPQDTLVLVTHKPEMLTLVDRLVVIAKHEVLLDGPKEQVLRQLQA